MTALSMAGGTAATFSSESLSFGPTMASRRSWLGTASPCSLRAAAIPSVIPPAGSTRVPSRSKITGTVVEVTGLVSHDGTLAQTRMPFEAYFSLRWRVFVHFSRLPGSLAANICTKTPVEGGRRRIRAYDGGPPAALAGRRCCRQYGDA